MAKTGEVVPQWWHVDGEDRIVGHLASKIAVLLMGKHRPTYTPHIDTGDFVIVTNVEKVTFSGNKWEKKEYKWYTGYPGLRSETAESRHAKRPDAILYDAVRRMLPKNKLGRQMLKKLKMFVGPDHTHQSQQPQDLDIGKKIVRHE